MQKQTQVNAINSITIFIIFLLKTFKYNKIHYKLLKFELLKLLNLV